MCRVTLAHIHRHCIRTTNLLGRVRIKPPTYYYRNCILRWTSHVARMPMARIPRKFLTGWVANPRPLGRPYMAWVTANRPAEVPSWANPHEHDTRRDAPGRS